MKKITILFCTAAMLFFSAANAQLFQNLIGKTDFDEKGYSVTRSVDGSYLIGGSFVSAFGGNVPTTPALVHLKSNGSVDWVRQVNGNKLFDVRYAEALKSPTGTADGYIALAYFPDSSYTVIRLTDAGTVVWARKLKLNKSQTIRLPKIKPVYSSPTSAPSFFLTFDFADFTVVETVIMKLDANGNTIWQRVIANPATNTGYAFNDIKVTNDSGCVLTGSSQKRITLCKLNAAGKLVLAKSYRFFTNSSGGNSIDQMSNGGYAITGFESGTDNNVTCKIAPNGQAIWAFRYKPQNNNKIAGQGVISDASGNIIVAGGVDADLGVQHAYIMKLNSFGVVTFAKEYASEIDIYDFKLTSQGYCAAGTKLPGSISGKAGIYVLQTNINGNIAAGCIPATVSYTRESAEFDSVLNLPFVFQKPDVKNTPVTVTTSLITTLEDRCSTSAPEAFIAETQTAGKLSAYPVNGNNDIRVEYKTTVESNNHYEVKLYNLNGEIFATASLRANQPVVLRADNLQQGMYIVALSNKDILIQREKIMIGK